VKNKAEQRIIGLSRAVTFESGHYLTGVPEGHKCSRQHGHSYEIRIWLSGPVQADGFVVDNSQIDGYLKTVRETFDHQNLNELGIDGLSENPTIENMLAWVHDNLPGKLHSLLDRIECKEGRNSMFVMLAQSRPSRHGT